MHIHTQLHSQHLPTAWAPTSIHPRVAPSVTSAEKGRNPERIPLGSLIRVPDVLLQHVDPLAQPAQSLLGAREPHISMRPETPMRSEMKIGSLEFRCDPECVSRCLSRLRLGFLHGLLGQHRLLKPHGPSATLSLGRLPCDTVTLKPHSKCKS